MNTAYLVDLENIGMTPLCRHVQQHPDAEYVIFHSDGTPPPGHILEQLPDNVRVTFTDCKAGGNNAMDFCICAAAGRMSAYSAVKVRILSNDKGYDPMVHMLQGQGVRIAREPVTYRSKPADPGTGQHCVTDKAGITAVIRKNVPKKEFQDVLIQKISGAANRKEAYEICQALLPDNLAVDIYRKLRKYVPKEEEL